MFNVICLETSEPERNEAGEALTFQTGQEAAAFAKSLTETRGTKYQPRRVLCDDWKAREAGRLADGTYTRLPWDDGYPEGNPNCLDYAWEAPRDWWIFDERGDMYDEATIAAIDNHSAYPTPTAYPPARGFAKSWFYEFMTDETRYHFAHVSSKVPGNIAFTANAERGAADIQTSMKPGKYLQQFYGHKFDQNQIRKMANQFVTQYGKLVLRWAETPDEIEHVYVNGPNSCMSARPDNYTSECHPVRVYGAGDVKVAYLACEDGDEITARALVFGTKYTRPYGDEDKLTNMLEAAGYTYDDDALEGARLLRIPQDDAFVCPYIDRIGSVSDRGKYLVITSDGEIPAQQTNGLSDCEGRTCGHCGERDREYNMTWVSDCAEYWCECCRDNHTFYCEATGNTYSDSADRTDVVVGRGRWGLNTETWGPDADRCYWFCEQTEDYFSDAIDPVVLHDGSTVSPYWFEDNGYSADNGECYRSYDEYREAEGIEDEDEAEGIDDDTEAKAITPRPVATQKATVANVESSEYQVGDIVHVQCPIDGSFYVRSGMYRITQRDVGFYGVNIDDGIEQVFHADHITGRQALRYRIGEHVTVRVGNNACAAPGHYEIIGFEIGGYKGRRYPGSDTQWFNDEDISHVDMLALVGAA